MKIFTTFILSCFTCVLLIGQSLTISPGLIEKLLDLNEFENVGYATLKNVSDRTITVVWTREIKTAPGAWEISICDKNNCYLPFVESREVELAPGEESNIDVHARHNNERGDGEIIMNMHDKNNPSDKTSATYRFMATVSASNVSFGEQLKLMPNPANQFFTISETKNAGRIEVLNMLGNLVRVYDARTATQFDISDLKSGIYMVRVISKTDASKSKTIRLRKI